LYSNLLSNELYDFLIHFEIVKLRPEGSSF